MKDKNPPLFILLWLALFITAAAFLPSLHNGFTNWDDPDYVTNNPLVKSLSFLNIVRIFTHFKDDMYKPLVHLSYAVEYHFFGLDPAVYHATNLFFHLLNCMLVFWFLFLLTRDAFVCFIAAVLFGVHPLHVESVAWVSERKDMLYGFFFLSGLAAYAYYQNDRSLKKYFLCLFLFFCSLISKPLAVSFPLILLLLDIFRGRTLTLKVWAEKIPFFAMSAVFGALVFWNQKTGGALDTARLLDLRKGILTMTDSFMFYVTKIPWPVNLSCLYNYPEKPGYFLNPSLPLSPILFVLICATALFLCGRSKKILFGSAFFFITIFPVLQLVPSGPAIAADRYFYLPSIGIFYLAGAGLSHWHGMKSKYPVFKKTVIVMLAASVIAFFAWLTWERCGVWKDNLTLWKDMVEKNPYDYTVYNDIGVEYKRRGDFGNALLNYNKALSLNPLFYRAYFNRGNVYELIGDFEGAFSDFNRAIQIKPDYAKAYNSRGIEYARRGQNALALGDLNKAIELDALFVIAYNNRGMMHVRLGDAVSAEKDFRKALSIDPDFQLAKDNLKNNDRK